MPQYVPPALNQIDFQLVPYSTPQLNQINFELEGAITYSGIFKRWTGTQWIKAKLLIYNGSTWVPAVLKRWTGTEWVIIDTTGI